MRGYDRHTNANPHTHTHVRAHTHTLKTSSPCAQVVLKGQVTPTDNHSDRHIYTPKHIYTHLHTQTQVVPRVPLHSGFSFFHRLQMLCWSPEICGLDPTGDNVGEYWKAQIAQPEPSMDPVASALY